MSKKKSRPTLQISTPHLLTVEQLAAGFGIHLKTAYKWLSEGRLPSINIGTPERPTVRVRFIDVESFLAERVVRHDTH